MADIQTGASVAGRVNVNATFQAQVGVNDDSTKNGILAATARLDDGSSTAVIRDVDLNVDQDFRLLVATDSIIFRETWNGVALNSSAWTSVATTMTAVVQRGQITLNSGSSVAASTIIRVQSYVAIPVLQTFPTAIRIPFRINATTIGISNQAWEVGLSMGVSGTTILTEGLALTMNLSGVLTFQSNFDGANAIGPAVVIDYSGLATGRWHIATFVVHPGLNAQLFINGALVAVLPKPDRIPVFFSGGGLSVFARMFNGSTGVITATQLVIGAITASVSGMDNPLPHKEASLLYGCESGSGQGGATLGSLSRTLAAGTAPTGAVPANISAALGSGLGGDFLHTNTLAIDTYGIISSYQVPVSAVGLNNKSLLITSVCIDTTVQAALTNAGAANYIWAIAFGHNNVSLTTTASGTSRAPVLLTVGGQAAIGNAVAGTVLNRVSAPCHFVAHPGEFIQAVVKNGGTVGGGGSLYHTIQFNGRWV